MHEFFNTLRPRRNEHFADDIFKRIFVNENAWIKIKIKISLKFVPNGPISNIPALIQIMAWRRSGDKPLSEPMMVNLLTHICVTRPQWVKGIHSRVIYVPFTYKNRRFYPFSSRQIMARSPAARDSVAIEHSIVMTTKLRSLIWLIQKTPLLHM